MILKQQIRQKVSCAQSLIFLDIKIFLGEDEDKEVIDEEMEEMETEGDVKDDKNERMITGDAQIRSSSIIRNQQDKFMHVPYQFTIHHQ
jgi:hypothetical protein